MSKLNKNDLTENQKIIYNLFPDYLLENDEFRAFIDIIADEWNYIQPLLEGVPDLTQPDKVPNKFLSYLSYLSDVKVVDSESHFSQREILKRVFDAYAERGTVEDLSKSAARANDRNWFIGDLTYYRGPLKEEPLSLTLPQYQMFTWSANSTWSGYDRYPDGSYWEDGVIILDMTNMTQATREAIERTIPAGRKYYFNNTVWITSDDIESDLNEFKVLVYDNWDVYDYQEIVYFLRINTKGRGLEISVNIPWNTGYWSDYQNLFDFQTNSIEMYASYSPNYSSSYNPYNLYYRDSSRYLYDIWETYQVSPVNGNYHYHVISPSRYAYLRVEVNLRSSDRVTVTDSDSQVIFTEKFPSGTSIFYLKLDVNLKSRIIQFKNNSSGNRVRYTFIERDAYHRVSTLFYPEWGTTPGFDDRISYKGSAGWDEDFIWSGRKSLSGHGTGTIYAGSQIYSIYPQDNLYHIARVDEEYPDTFRNPFYSHEIEISFDRNKRLSIDGNRGLDNVYDADDKILDDKTDYAYTTSSRVIDANIVRELDDIGSPEDLENQRKELRLKGFKWSTDGTWSGKSDRSKEHVIYGKTEWSGPGR